MRLILTHITHGQQDYEQIEVEGESYEALLAEATRQVPEGRIGTSIRVER